MFGSIWYEIVKFASDIASDTLAGKICNLHSFSSIFLAAFMTFWQLHIRSKTSIPVKFISLNYEVDSLTSTTNFSSYKDIIFKLLYSHAKYMQYLLYILIYIYRHTYTWLFSPSIHLYTRIKFECTKNLYEDTLDHIANAIKQLISTRKFVLGSLGVLLCVSLLTCQMEGNLMNI